MRLNRLGVLLFLYCSFAMAATKFSSRRGPKESRVKNISICTDLFAPETEFIGTGDGGGGNTIYGRPIESYWFDVMRSSAYVKYIKPITDALAEHGDDTYRLFTYALRKKNWYLVPPRGLPRLTAKHIGSVVNVEQGAFQTFREVWIDAETFSKMSKRDQASLIMHEILIGLRLLPLDSPHAQCLAISPDETYCDDLSLDPFGRPKDLTAHDYQDIRKATVDLFQLDRNQTQEDWEHFFSEHGFVGINGHPFLRKGDRAKISASEFVARLNGAMTAGYLPTIGSSNSSLEGKHESCTVTFNSAADSLTFKILRADGDPIEGQVWIPPAVDLTTRRQFGHRIMVTQPFSPILHQHEVGTRHLEISFGFDGRYSLAVVNVWEMVCTGVAANGMCRHFVSPTIGFNYTCSSFTSSTKQ